MIDSDRFYTAVFKDLTDAERKEVIYHNKFSAGSYSHALDDRDDALFMLSYAESTLAEIAHAETDECVEWVAQALPRIRDLLRKHGRYPKPHKSFQDVMNECYSGVL